MCEPGSEGIDVGAADGTFRLCFARETARQGELALAGQASNLQAAEGRAASLLGWSIAALSALAVLAVDKPHRWLAIAPGCCMFACALACIWALWPKVWHTAGYSPEDLGEWQVSTELELLEGLASGYRNAAAENRQTMGEFGWRMRAAWLAFVLAPTSGILVLLLKAD